jgi:DNA-binding NtrC family response regulator
MKIVCKPPQLIGSSETIRGLDEEIRRAAGSDAKVLVTGEPGVGKGLVAQLIHGRSARSAAPMVTVNCAGLTGSLLESELFGHVRGSFTGAYRDKMGLLETAHNGTVFVDAAGEMSVRMQVVLLRFLETGEIQRVGAERPHTRVNVRLIAATSRDLRTQIRDGAFREDVYFRLNVIRFTIPALRDRREDIPLLIDHYVAHYAEEYGVRRPHISPDAMDALLIYSWPGNVRELKNVIEQLVLGERSVAFDRTDLPIDISSHRQRGADTAIPASGASATGPQQRT